jgi:hypothetical protein
VSSPPSIVGDGELVRRGKRLPYADASRSRRRADQAYCEGTSDQITHVVVNLRVGGLPRRTDVQCDLPRTEDLFIFGHRLVEVDERWKDLLALILEPPLRADRYGLTLGQRARTIHRPWQSVLSQNVFLAGSRSAVRSAGRTRKSDCGWRPRSFCSRLRGQHVIDRFVDLHRRTGEPYGCNFSQAPI